MKKPKDKKGRKNKRRGDYVVEIPLGLLPIKQLVSQSATVTRLAANLRPVFYVAGGAEEVGTGGDGEPLLGGGFRLKPLPRFVRVDMPGWWGEEGRRFSDAYNDARKNLGVAQMITEAAELDRLLSRIPPLEEAIFDAIGEEVARRAWRAEAEVTRGGGAA